MSVLEHIGRTPLVRLGRIGADLPVPVLVKCEHLSPGAFVAGAGAGGTLSGVGRRLEAALPGARGHHPAGLVGSVAASTGSACHEGHERPSDGILSLGLTPEDALGTVRLTLGRGTSPEDVERAADALARAYHAALRP